MTISYVGTGGPAAGSTSLSVAYPTGLSAGDVLLLAVTNKYPSNPPLVPSGWSFGLRRTGGSGAAGADAGSVYVTVFWKLSDGTESGNVSVSIPSGNSATGDIFAYRASNGFSDVSFEGGADNTAGTAWSVSASMRIYENDWVVAISGANTDSPTFSSHAITAASVTFGTTNQRVQTRTTQGDDSMMWVCDAPLSDGAGTLTLNFASTASGSGTNYPAGATVFVGLFETLAGSLSKTLGAMTLAASGTLYVPITASLTKTLGAMTLDADATMQEIAVANLAQTLGAMTLESDATFFTLITASLTKTLGAMTLQSEATVKSPITANLAQTLGAMTLEASGKRYALDGEGFLVPFRWSETRRRYGFVAPEREIQAEVP